MVLGIQWLCTLGPILWEFNKLQMTSKHEDKDLNLKGVMRPLARLVD